jgi:hypothetical protein
METGEFHESPDSIVEKKRILWENLLGEMQGFFCRQKGKN